MGLFVGGKLEDTPFKTITWADDPTLRLKMGEDGTERPAGTWIRGVVLHTTSGFPKDPGDPQQSLKPGLGPFTRAAHRINTIVWEQDHRCAGSHLLVDADGTTAQLADLQSEMTYHAGPVNAVTIGIEIYQDPKDGSLYDGQLDAVVVLCDWLTKRFKIQRQIPLAYVGPVDRLAAGGAGVVGVYGHRDVASSRGMGDPGDFVFEKLAAAGYERFHLETAEDRSTWIMRQKRLGVTDDGVPGPGTCEAIVNSMPEHPLGLWITRPGD